jgi:PST family polysaccharide transporter
MFHQIALIEVAANLLGAACAITMAFCGLGYWALVIRPIATTLLVAAGVWLRSRWVPAKPAITEGVKEMLKFGMHLTGFCMTDFVARCSDRVVIGIRSGAKPLGYYQQAMLVYENMLDLTVALHGVAAASLSKLRDNLTELRRLWAKGLSTLAFYAMPAFGVLAVTSQDLIVLLLGNKWSNAGILLSVLALRGIPHVVERTLGWLHIAAGRADRWMQWGVVAAFAQIIALFCGLPFGPMGVVTAYVLCMYALFVPSIAYGGSPLGIGAADVIGVIGRPLTGALISAGLGFVLRYTLLTDMSGPTRIALLVLAYFISYFIIVVGIFKVRTPLYVVLSLLRHFLPARFATLTG